MSLLLGLVQNQTQSAPTLDVQITISVDQSNYNMLTAFTNAYRAPIPGDKVEFIIDAGVAMAGDPAITTDSWPAGVDLILTNNSVNCAGAGGDGNGPNPGRPGKTCLEVLSPLTLFNVNGSLAGGGGGGAGTDQWTGQGNQTYQAGGGGGAGRPPGLGYIITNSTTFIANGVDGTFTTGGPGGTFGNDPNQPPQIGSGGGDGGALGSSGLDAGDVAQPGSQDNVGGPPGSAIDGISFVTFPTPADQGTLIGPLT